MRACIAAFLLLAALAAPAAAKDYFLTIGGGYARTGNQASLEKNVLFSQRVLKEAGVPAAQQGVYFADGTDARADLQVRDVAAIPQANQLMAEFFGDEDDLGLLYRNHAVAGVRGATSKANIERWFREVGPTLARGDRLVIYVTAHGQRSEDDDNDYETAISLWNNEQLRVRELVRMLDTLPEGVSVTAIMVQCYTGGFARIIYKDADPEQGVSPQTRCGFFATVHDRVAAGCTPDVDKASYVEYSSYFWEAVSGKKQTGEAIAKPDYDGDGRVSFAEAHAYTVLNAETIDLPVKTSGEYLSVESQFADEEQPGLLAADAPYEEVLKRATPAERAVLEGLSTQLGLTGSDRMEAADRGIDESRPRFRRRGRGFGRSPAREAGRIREQIANDLRAKWPELSNVLNPGAIDLLTKRSAEFVAAVQAHPRYAEYRKLMTTASAAPDPEKKRVKFERFVATAEDVILRENLKRLGDATRIAAYEAIVVAEGRGLK
jgi:hypothetical protein